MPSIPMKMSVLSMRFVRLRLSARCVKIPLIRSALHPRWRSSLLRIILITTHARAIDQIDFDASGLGEVDIVDVSVNSLEKSRLPVIDMLVATRMSLEY
jgi:hypothetical protein